MPIKVSEFLSTIASSKAFARPNLYRVEIYPPEGLRVDTTILKNLSVNCKSASFPGVTLESQSYLGGGYLARFTPFALSYAPISLGFNLSGDLKEKKFFEEWIKMAYNDTTNTLNYYDEFVGTIIVSQLNRSHQVTKSYQLFEAFPLSVNDISVSNEMENEVSELLVNIGYRKHKDLT